MRVTTISLDEPVLQPDGPVRNPGNIRVVGHHQDRDPAVVQRGQDRHDAGAGSRVQASGRLVGQYDRRLADQRPRDGDPLALAPGQLGGPVPGPVTEADPLERGGRGSSPLGCRAAAVQQSAGDVVDRGEAGSRTKCWKTKPILAARIPDSALSESPATDWPAIRTVPLVGRSSVPASASSVDLPEPDGPTTAVSSPAATARLTDRSAATGGVPG